MIRTQEEIRQATALIAAIDSGEGRLFTEFMGTQSQMECRLFGEPCRGVFFSLMFAGTLRIAAAFLEDTDTDGAEVSELINASLQKSGQQFASVWLRNDNKKLISYLQRNFPIIRDGNYDYASVEYVLSREAFLGEKFDGEWDYGELDIRPYEQEHIDEYLELLDASMTFASPPANYRGRRERYLTYFDERRASDSFEAFWTGGELAGLYWREGAEIDTLAVAPRFQRRGYGSRVLTRAIAKVFSQTGEPSARLYAVDWNEKGQAFYKKYGMRANAHSYQIKIQIPQQ